MFHSHTCMYHQQKTKQKTAYEIYFVDQLPYTDDELVAMSKESLKELKATAASVSIADAESRSAK